jgi:hypothetical protein
MGRTGIAIGTRHTTMEDENSNKTRRAIHGRREHSEIGRAVLTIQVSRQAISDSRWLCTTAVLLCVGGCGTAPAKGLPNAVPGSITVSVRKMRKGVRERNTS